MMGWDWPGMHGYGFLAMIMGTLLVLGPIVALVVVLLAGGSRSVTGSGRSGARDILDQRYARGEIDDDEYQRRLQTLGS